MSIFCSKLTVPVDPTTETETFPSVLFNVVIPESILSAQVAGPLPLLVKTCPVVPVLPFKYILSVNFNSVIDIVLFKLICPFVPFTETETLLSVLLNVAIPPPTGGCRKIVAL